MSQFSDLQGHVGSCSILWIAPGARARQVLVFASHGQLSRRIGLDLSPLPATDYHAGKLTHPARARTTGGYFIAFPTDLYLRPHLRPRYSSLGLLFWSGPVAARIKVEAAARQLHVGGRVPTKSRPQLATEEGFNQPTYRGMRIQWGPGPGPVWSSQRGRSGL